MTTNPIHTSVKDHSKRKTKDGERSAGNKSPPSFDQLVPAFVQLSDKLTTTNQQVMQLTKVDNAVKKFNDAFGAFLFGLSANGTTVRWPKAPTRFDFEKHSTQVAQVVGNQPKNPISTTVQPNSNKEATVMNKTSGGRVIKNKKIAAKFVNKINIKNIIEHLPLKYREQTEHMKTMETVLRALRLKTEGMNMSTMVKKTGLPQYRVTDCLNALVRSKDVEKSNPKGQPAIYKLDKAKYRTD